MFALTIFHRLTVASVLAVLLAPAFPSDAEPPEVLIKWRVQPGQLRSANVRAELP